MVLLYHTLGLQHPHKVEVNFNFPCWAKTRHDLGTSSWPDQSVGLGVLPGMDPFARRFMWSVIQDGWCSTRSNVLVMVKALGFRMFQLASGFRDRTCTAPRVYYWAGCCREAQTVGGRVDHALHGRSRGHRCRRIPQDSSSLSLKPCAIHPTQKERSIKHRESLHDE